MEVVKVRSNQRGYRGHPGGALDVPYQLVDVQDFNNHVLWQIRKYARYGEHPPMRVWIKYLRIGHPDYGASWKVVPDTVVPDTAKALAAAHMGEG